MGNGFGEKLRAERLERGLTQAELGKDLYSPSYISLLETGRREPTAEVIEELARRLELAPKALEAWSQPISVSDAEYVLAGLYATPGLGPPGLPPGRRPRRHRRPDSPRGEEHQRLVEHDLHAGRMPHEAGPAAGMPEHHAAPPRTSHGHRIGRPGGACPADARRRLPRAGPAGHRRRACPEGR